MDSGASAHSTKELADFAEYEMGDFGTVITASQKLRIQAKGTILLKHKLDGKEVVLRLYLKELTQPWILLLAKVQYYSIWFISCRKALCGNK